VEKKEILTKIQCIFRDILDNEDIILDNNTTANDIEEWHSLTHILLVVAIEKAFKIKFTSKEILSWENIGEMVDCVSNKKPII
jgi:acyl carrier protein